MWRRVSCEQQSVIVSGLLRKLERFRHAVVEPSCHGVQRSLARFRTPARVGAVFVVFPSSVVSGSQFVQVEHVLWLQALSKVHKSSCRSHPSWRVIASLLSAW